MGAGEAGPDPTEGTGIGIGGRYSKGGVSWTRPLSAPNRQEVMPILYRR